MTKHALLNVRYSGGHPTNGAACCRVAMAERAVQANLLDVDAVIEGNRLFRSGMPCVREESGRYQGNKDRDREEGARDRGDDENPPKIESHVRSQTGDRSDQSG